MICKIQEYNPKKKYTLAPTGGTSAPLSAEELLKKNNFYNNKRKRVPSLHVLTLVDIVVLQYSKSQFTVYF
jgi:hypothetical protein